MTNSEQVNHSNRKYPFAHLKIADYSILKEIDSRSPCYQCGKSRKYFCYTCCVPISILRSRIPEVRLPVKIDIIKHPSEMGKSSAVHARILAPEDVSIHTYPEIPDYSKEEGVVLIFPCVTSSTISQLFGENVHLVQEEEIELPVGYNVGTLLKSRLKEERDWHESASPTVPASYTLDNLPIKKAVFIDSTWNQSRGIYKDDRINRLTAVVIQNRISQFWRHQKGSPRWYLATIEAIHQFLLEVHINAFGLNNDYRGLDELEIVDAFLESARATGKVRDYEGSFDCDAPTAPYNGHYDNLLFFFAHMYDLIHIYYDHNELKSYKRPI